MGPLFSIAQRLASALLLTSWVIPGAIGQAQTHGSDRNIWQEVQVRAAAVHDRKALWRELKKLTPEDLLICGEQFCASLQQEPQKSDIDGLLVTVNAILSYHKDKTSYEQTAEAVGHIIQESATSTWVYAAMAWIENNDHFKQIPEAGMRSVGAGICSCLSDPSRPVAVRLAVLQQVCSYAILSALPAEPRARIADLCGAIAGGKGEPELVRQAERSVTEIGKVLQELGQDSRTGGLRGGG
jgi:hypothetical protein